MAFEALSLMSTEFGVTEYLHGHQPSFTTVCPAEDGRGTSTSLNVRLPPRTGAETPLVLNLTAWPAESAEGNINSHLAELQQSHQLSTHELWTVLNIKTALRGFQADMDYRLKVVKIRLYSFFLLVHSKISPATIQDYLRSDSRFLQDLVELSDLSSEASSELSMQQPAALAYLALENVLGLLENKLRRRSSFVIQSSILPVLGMSNNLMIANSGRSEGAWTSIVMAACAAAPLLFNCTASGVSTPSSPAGSPGKYTASSPSRLASPQKDNEISSLAKFIRIGMELFILSLTERDPAHVVHDMPLISTIVGVIQGAIPHMERIFVERKARTTAVPCTAYEVHVFLVVAKALYCLEVVADRPGYLAALRESEGIPALTRVIQLFAEAAGGADAENKFAFLDPAARNAVESAFSCICVVIQKSRHTVVLQGNTSDTGVRIVYETYFGDLCTKAFTSPFEGNETLWAQLITLIKEAIDLDPSYLSHFLASSYADVLLKVLQIPFGAAFPAAMFAPKATTNLEGLLVPLARLAGAVAITPEGRGYVTRARIVHFILEAMVQPCCLLPSGRDIDVTRVMKLGKLIGQLMSDHDELRSPLRDILKKKVIAFAKEATDCWKALDPTDAAQLCSSRLQALQKLADLCTLIENTFPERRARQDDSLREILCQPVLECLMAAFPATLPPPRQLLAQLAIRHVHTVPYYGHSASSKAISSLLKLAVGQVSHSSAMITLVSREIDVHLNAMSAAQQVLLVGAAAPTLGAKPASVQVLGVLDRFQHRCVMDPAFEQVGAEESQAAFKFLTSVMSIEWLSILLAQAIRTDQRVQQSSRSTLAYKDTLRRLFAFHKSSLLEVCRFSSSKWSPKPLSESRFKKTLPDALCRCDSLEDSDFIPRIPVAYRMRVSGTGGALVREGIEIEGSRVVLVADVGSELTAYERRINLAGVMRFRTDHGWISEFRRDLQKNPIVELLELPVLSAQDIDNERQRRTEWKTDADKQAHLAMEALTLRESVCVCLTKANTSLRQVSIYLSRSMFPQQEAFSYRGTQPTVSPTAPVVSAILGKGVKGFFSFARNCADESALPEGQQSAKKVPSSSDFVAEGTAPANPVPDLTASLAPGSSKKKRSRDAVAAADDDDSKPDHAGIDVSTLCLFYGVAVKQMLLPLLEDKNGCLNILLLRTLCNHGVVQQLVDAFSVALLVLRDAVDARSESQVLSAAGQCALHSLPSLLSAMQNLVSRDLFTRSLAQNPTVPGAPTPALTDEIGPYQAHDLLFQVLSTVRAGVLSLLQSNVLQKFPSHVQYDWFSIVGELVANLNATLPPPTVTRTSYSRTDTAAQSPGMMSHNSAPRTMQSLGAGRFTPQAATPSAPSPVRSFVPDPQMVDMLAEMGFEREHIISTVTSLRTTNMDMITQHMFNNPWTPPATAVPPAAAATSTENAEAPVPGPATEQQSPPPSTEPADTAGPAESAASVGVPPAPDAGIAGTPAAEMPPAPPNAPGSAPSPGSLPNLVPELDESNEGEGSPAPMAESLGLTAVQEVNLLQGLVELSQSVRGNATAQSALERFRENMDLLMNEQQATSSPRLNRLLAAEMTTPMANADDQLGRGGARSVMGGQRATWTPDGSSQAASSKDKADGDKEARDYAAQGQQLTAWAKEICALVVPNFTQILLNYEKVCLWDKKENHILIPFMVELLLKLNQGEITPRTLPYSDIFSEMLQCLHNETMQSPADERPLPRIYGLLCFVTQFIVEPSVRKVLVDGRHLTRACAIGIVDTLTSLLQSTVAQPALHWPKWVSPAMMLLYELLSQPCPAEDRRKPGSNGTRLGMWDEKDEHETLEEQKLDTNSSCGIQAENLLASHGDFRNQAFLLTSAVREDLFRVIMSVITASLSSAVLPADAQQGTLVVLLALLNNQKNVNAFVQSDGLRSVLVLIERDPSVLSRTMQPKMLTLIVQRCMETEVELQQLFEQHIRDIHRGNTSEDKCLPFAAFIQALTPDLMRSPEDFWQACKHTVKIIKVPSSTRKGERGVTECKNEIKVRLLDSEQLLEVQALRAKSGDVDNRAYQTLVSIVQYVVKTANKKKEISASDATDQDAEPSTTVSGALNAVSDAILSLRRSPMLAARLIKSETETIGLHAGESFVDFLLTTFFAEGLVAPTELAPAKVNANGDLAACSRVLVALCAFKGATRVFTLNSVLKSLRTHAVSLLPSAESKSTSVAPSNAEVLRQAETKRVLLLSRLACLVGIIIRASKTSPKEGASSKGQGVSVDTLHYLIEHGRILKLLTHALSSVPVHLQVSAGAVSAILDLMELITRPKIQAHLDKLANPPVSGEKSGGRADDAPRTSSQTSIDGDAVSSSEQGADEFFAIGAEDSSFSRTLGSSQHSISPGVESLVEGLQAHFTHLSHSGDAHDDHDAQDEQSEDDSESEESEDEDEDEDNEGDEEEGEEADDDDGEEEDEESEEESEEEDDGNDEDGDDADDADAEAAQDVMAGYPQHGELPPDEAGDVNDGGNGAENMFEAHGGEDDDDDSGEQQDELLRHLIDEINTNGEDAYVNIDNIMNAGSASDRTTDIFAQLRDAVYSPDMEGLEARDLNLHGNAFITPPMNTHAADIQFMVNGMNVNDPHDIAALIRQMTANARGERSDDTGVRRAGEVRQESGMSELLPQGIAAALDVAPSFINRPMLGHEQFMPRVPGASAGTPMMARMPPMPGSRTAQANATFMRRHAIGGMAGMPVMHSATGRQNLQMSGWNDGVDILGSNLDMNQYDEFDTSMQAGWPRGLVPDSAAHRRSAANNSQATVTTDMAQLVLQHLEDNLIEGLELIEESADEVSQGSFTENSRGDGGHTTEGGFSYSTQSNVALQDPNPRGRGEADSRLGDPIPPIIEIDNPGHEGNEELSVITLPQEDPNAPDHDDQPDSAHAHSPTVRSPAPSVQFEASAADMPVVDAAADAGTSELPSPAAGEPLASPAALRLDSPQSPVATEPPAPLTPVDAIAGIAFDSLLSALSGISLVPASPTPAPRLEVPTEAPAPVDDAVSAAEVAVEEDISALEQTAEVPAEEPTEEEEGTEAPLDCPPGYDSDVFYSLPVDMQMEIIEQSAAEASAGETPVDETRALIEAAGFDYESFNCLPESIREEVLEQARREQRSTANASAGAAGSSGSGGGGGGGQDIDNATFLASLTLELRAEVLLTADAEFLATLPPNLVAEAQMIREQAASSWQRRELMSRMGTREGSASTGAAANAAGAGIAAAVGAVGIGAPGEFYGDEDDDEDQDDQDEEDLDALQLMPRGRDGFRIANYGNNARGGGSKPERPKTGLMRVPGSYNWSMKIPKYLVVSILKMMLNAPKRPARANMSFRILQNISTDLRSKDVCLKLLLGLVAEHEGLLLDSLKQLCGADIGLNVLIDGNVQTLFADVVAKPSLVGARNSVAADVRLDINSVAAQRIIEVLAQLVSGNSAFVYLLLSERDHQFTVADQDAVAKLQAAKQTVPPAELTQVVEESAEQSAESEGKGPAPTESEAQPSAKAAEIKRARVISSSNSMLELLITLFAKPEHTSSAHDLESLANLLSTATAPLDSLPDETVADGSTANAVVSKESAIRDAKHHVVTLPVPRVVLSREALGYLCDVLLNDLCSKRVLSNITSAISRLSKIYQNHSQLIELIVDVIADLADQSQIKLDALGDTLKQVHSKYTANHKAQPPKPKAAIDSPARVKASSLKMSADEVSSPVKGSQGGASSSASAALPTSLLPLGESGSKQHERLLRVVQTLHSMAVKTKRQLSDVAPTEHLALLWRGLDKVLQQLRHYLVDVDEEENAEKETGESIRPQSTLTSILNRLLPAIEAFFLVHASDFLVEKPRSGGDKPAAAEVSAPKATTSDHPSPPPSDVAPAASTSTCELIPLSSMPGHSYRTSPAYLRNNISLFAADSGSGAGPLDEGSPLQATRSLRKQPSLTSMNSRIGSVLTSRGHRLLHFVQANKGLLNLIVKSNPALLDDSLSSFVRITQLRACLKFDNKRKYFFTQMKRSNQTVSRRGVHLQIRRNQVFEDSFHQLRVRTAEEMRGRLQVNFYGEEGVDAGGLSREWYVILAREIFNPNYALFTAAADGATFQPNPLSMINTNHLDYFKFVGRLIGKAICDGQLLDAHFTRYAPMKKY